MTSTTPNNQQPDIFGFSAPNDTNTPDPHATPVDVEATPEQLARHRRRLQEIQAGHITADEAIAQLLEEETL